MLRDGRFRWAGGVVLALLLIAVMAGWQHYRTLRAEHDAAQHLTWEHWLEQGEKNPHSAAHFGVYAFKPKQPLSLVDRGVDPYVGVATWLEAHYQNPFQGRPAQDATVLARFGELTAAGVLQLLVPLLIVLLGFGAFGAEREGGTMRQLLSLGVRPRDLAWGKALGLAGGLALLLVPAALLGAVALTLGSAGDSIPAMGVRIALLGLTYLAYFAVFVGVTLAVSAHTRSSRVALVGLLGFWMVNALVAPRFAADLARHLHPTPSQAEFTAAMMREMDEGIDGHSPADARLKALEEQLLAEHGVERLEDLPINFAGVAFQAGEEYGNLVFDRHFGGLEEIFARQESVHRWLGLAAPLLATRSLSMGLAGTDLAQHRHFATEAEEHRRLIQRIMNDDLTHNSRQGETYLAGPELWARVPEFRYEAPGLGWVLGHQIGAAGLLLLWVGFAAAAVFLSPRRLKVE